MACSVTDMNRNRGGGRPSKGDRHDFKVRLPRAEADHVMDYAETTGQAYSDVIAGLVLKHIDELDLQALEYGDNRLEVGEKTA